MTQKIMPFGIGKFSGITVRSKTDKSAKKKNGKTMPINFLLIPKFHETNICDKNLNNLGYVRLFFIMSECVL